MSRDWTWAELQAASKAMKAMGYMSYEELCEEMERQDELNSQTTVSYDIFKDGTWETVTEEELREVHEESIEADINTPEYQKADYEQESGNVWEDTPDDFEEFKAQLIADGVLRIKM